MRLALFVGVILPDALRSRGGGDAMGNAGSFNQG